MPLSSTVSRIDQTILNEFIQDGYFERYLNKMRKQYREKHDLLLNELKPFEKAFQISGSNAGLHVVLTDRKRRTEEELARIAVEVDVKAYCMKDFRMEDSRVESAGMDEISTMMILGYGALTPDEIQEGMALLKRVWIS